MEKGTYGYGKKKLKAQILKLAACCALVFGALTIGLITTGNRKNIWTVGAICSVLPAATFAVNVIARCKGLPLKSEDYERLAEVSEGLVLSCDMIVTAGQKLIPVQAAVFHETGITAYTASKKVEVKQAEKDINGLLKSIGVYSKIQLYTDYSAFLKRVDGIQPSESDEKKKELEKKKGEFLVYSM